MGLVLLSLLLILPLITAIHIGPTSMAIEDKSETKEIDEGASKIILNLPIQVLSADENSTTLTATIKVGDSEISLSNEDTKSVTYLGKKYALELVSASDTAATIKVTAISMTSKVIENNSNQNSENSLGDQEINESTEDVKEENETEIQDECEEWKCTKWHVCVNGERTRTCAKIKNCVTDNEKPKTSKTCEEKERIKSNIRATECPNDCICTGSVTKCTFANGTREITITAGKSGNVIVQVKGINASTTLTLYKSDDGKLYSVNKNNETKKIRILPDQVREKIREKLAKQFENESISLDENGIYEYSAEKKSKLFAMFPIKAMVKAEIDPETGKIIKVTNPWWSFLAKDDKSEEILGASCGTVTPGENDACCKTKEYDIWNPQTSECEFNAE